MLRKHFGNAQFTVEAHRRGKGWAVQISEIQSNQQISPQTSYGNLIGPTNKNEACEIGWEMYLKSDKARK